MPSILLSLDDYRDGLAAGLYAPPDTLCPYYEVDPVLFRQLGSSGRRWNDIKIAMLELRKRTGRKYFGHTYPLQARTLDYSIRSFPAYKFILPEVMTEDWLAIVDWGKFQRDHILHQPLCGYVVLKLLKGLGTFGPLILPNGQTLLDACVDRILRWNDTVYIRDFLVDCGMSENDPILDARSPIARSIWRIFFLEAAYVAAVFHDLGYPWEYAGRMQDNLDGINAPALRQNRSAEEVLQLFGHRLLFHALHGYRLPDVASPSTWHNRIIQITDAALSKTHGFPGALGFLHLNDCIRRYPHAMQSPLHLLCVEWAATAIMMHDMANIYWGSGLSNNGIPENPSLRVSFDRDPLSAIITLTDVIQDFERPTVRFQSPGSKVRLQYNTACSGTEIELDSGGILRMQYKMTSNSERILKRSNLPKEKRKYFDSRYGYLNMSSIGVNDVRLFAV